MHVVILLFCIHRCALVVAVFASLSFLHLIFAYALISLSGVIAMKYLGSDFYLSVSLQ